MKEAIILSAVSAVSALILSLIFGRIILPVLQKRKAGQYINSYVPDHQKKAGTPTMGGISFVPAFLLVVAAVMVYWSVAGAPNGTMRTLIPVAMVALYAVANAAIGFVDDWFKLNKRQNEGLTEKQKFLLQTVAAAAFIAMMAITGNLTTVLHIPFTDIFWNISYFAYPLYLLVLVGFVNATNITDGLDGLASSICATVTAFAVVFAVLAKSQEIALSAAALLGCVLGFLFYNRHPAKMFMGDTGSLFLGGVIMGCAVMAGELLLFVLAGFMFVIEMLTSLMQKYYYKLTGGKRIFRMAPLHHHFERGEKPWSEKKIVLVFTAVSLAFCILAYFGI